MRVELVGCLVIYCVCGGIGGCWCAAAAAAVGADSSGAARVDQAGASAPVRAGGASECYPNPSAEWSGTVGVGTSAE
jgi:hypothetical protein